MNNKVITIAAEEANKELSKQLLIWQNVAAVSIVGNIIAVIVLVVILT